MRKLLLIPLIVLAMAAVFSVTAYAVAAVEIANPTSVTDSAATLNGAITTLGGDAYVQVRFEWGVSPAYGTLTTSQYLYSAAPFSQRITGLVSGQTYRYRVAWTNNATWQYTSTVDFLAQSVIPEGVNNDWALIPSNPSDPGFYNEMNMTFIGAGWLTAFANVSTIPIDLLVMIFAYGLSLGFGLWAYRITMGKTNKYQQAGAMGLRPGSLFVQAMVSGLILVYFSFSGGGVIPSWTILPFAIEAVAAILIRQNNGQVVG